MGAWCLTPNTHLKSQTLGATAHIPNRRITPRGATFESLNRTRTLRLRQDHQTQEFEAEDKAVVSREDITNDSGFCAVTSRHVTLKICLTFQVQERAAQLR